jgi:hypothetical protein
VPVNSRPPGTAGVDIPKVPIPKILFVIDVTVALTPVV